MNAYIFVLLIFAAVSVSALMPFLAVRLWGHLGAGRANLTKAILWLIYCGGGASILVSGRKLSLFLSVDSLADTSSFASSVVDHLLQLFAVFFCLYAASCLVKSSARPQFSRRTVLVTSFLMLGFVVPFLSGVFGAMPYLRLSLFLMPTLFIAATINYNLDIDELFRSLKGPLAVLLGLSLVLAPLIPNLVMEPYPIGKILHFPFRMWGLTLHANTLGPLGFLLLLIEISAPSSTIIRRAAVLSVALICFVLAQSKTAWLGGFVSIAFIFIYGVASSKRVSAVSRVIYLCLAGSLLLVVLAASLGEASQIAYAANDRSLGGGNFSGRTQIWDVAMDQWRRHPLFGYGPSIWSPDFRQSVRMNFAFHAHNQFFQTVGESGWVGLVTLSFYLLILIFAAYAGVTKGRPFMAAYLVFILVRCVSEPTFRTVYAFGSDAMLHFPLFLVAFTEFLGFYRSRNESKILNA